MKRIAIIGGGMSGLLASYVFQQYRNVDVTVFEPGKPGAAFLAGGLKYLSRTDDVVEMLHDFGQVFTNYSVNGGIFLQGAVQPYPKCLSSMDPERAKRVQRDHYRKTRRTQPDDFAVKSMNDPEANPASRRAVSTDLKTLVRNLTSISNIRTEFVGNVFTNSRDGGPVTIRLGNGANNYASFDHCVMTLPIWVARKLCDFGESLPETQAMKLNLVFAEPLRDPYARWDYVYTPYTPEGLIHRISPNDLGYGCELNGEWKEGETNDRVASELNFLFPDGWVINDVKKGLNGHLLPPPSKPIWPDNVKPLGRFAKWDPRATTDVTMKDARKLAEEWGFDK